jgi:hypothetical protein
MRPRIQAREPCAARTARHSTDECGKEAAGEAESEATTPARLQPLRVARPRHGGLGRPFQSFVEVDTQTYTRHMSSTRSGLKGSRPGRPRCTRTASRKTFTKA